MEKFWKKPLIAAVLMTFCLSACSDKKPTPNGSASASTPKANAPAMTIPPKAAAPIATDERTPAVNPKTGTPEGGSKP
ncbi:MAG: hypothetical protein IK089_06620 [Oxalobacter sp.]|nr:hypothetical protein [Oxalobacter sp.]